MEYVINIYYIFGVVYLVNSKFFLKLAVIMLSLLVVLNISEAVFASSELLINIEGLLEELLDRNFGVSNKASEALVDIGEPVVKVLGETMLRENNGMNRLKIVNVLRRIESGESIDYFIAALGDSETVVRDAAVRALTEYGDAAVERVREMLLSISYRQRVNAHEALLALGQSNEDICNYVKDFLFSHDQKTRQITLWLLREMGVNASSMVPALSDILQDDQEDLIIRLTVLETLNKIQPNVIELSSWAMAINSVTIKNFERLFWLANDYLVRAGSEAASVIFPLLDSSDPEIRAYAVSLLSKIGKDDSTVEQKLNKALADMEWYVRQAVYDGLGQDANARSNKMKIDTVVQINDVGGSVTLDNGIVRLGISKETGVVNLLYAYDHDLLGPGGRIYYDTITTPGGTWWPSPSRYQIICNDSEMAHVVFTKPATKGQPLAVDLNFILRQGDSGYYFYVVYHHETDYAVDFGQARNVIRFDQNLFKYKAIENFKMGRMPTDELWNNGEQVMDATQRLADGSVYSKYNWQVYEGEHELHGIMGENLGLWMISASREYLNGGPVKQNRTVHHADVLLQIMQSGHFGAGGNHLPANCGWEKMYGPHFIYVNQGKNLAEMWMDAKVQAKIEAAAWPYQWVDHQLYPLERSTVSGSVKLTDGSCPADGWVILAPPGPHWQHQGTGYQFWTKIDENGNFIINNVRSGEYTLYINIPGVLSEYSCEGIRVETPQPLDLGEFVWTPKTHGGLVWEIGIPDRSGAEFFISGNDYRNWGLWFDYPRNFPNGVVYRIGESDYRTDWNHYQPIVVYGEDGEENAAPWEIIFNIAQVPDGKGFLTIAVAGSTENNVVVRLNGESLGLISRDNDSAVYRSAIRGIYSEHVFQFNTSLLKNGENRVTLEVTGNRAAHRGIIYDYLRLEIDEK